MYPLIIIDDEEITRIAVSGYIQKKHPQFQVSGIFSNGADALRFMRENPVSVVITDIRMPRMDGLELARHIYENHPGVLTIIISGYSEFEYAQKAMRYGVVNYLLKPLDFEELSRNLNDAQKHLDSLKLETDVNEEEIQLFFIDLISGMLNDTKEAARRFEQLSLEGVISDYKGCLTTLTLEKNDTLTQWKYGREKLAVSLLNGLRMLLPGYSVYHLFRSGMRYYFIVLSTQELPAFNPEELSSALFHLLHFDCNLQIQPSFENLETLSAPSAPLDVTRRNIRPENAGRDDDIVIQKAMSYIQAHFQDDLTREDVADAVFLSSAYFSRFFKQKTGLSFIDYLTTVRMQKAVELLGTRMKVGEIARKVGYQSRNRFFINFRLYTGYNPTEYRRQILRMEDEHEDTEE
ncbi:MAG TPA: hypothetical protein DCZ91_02415 [Lachnospiraceae bacterium]|nr:hypothetical protein [Lachnospiraceae bacterium]